MSRLAGVCVAAAALLLGGCSTIFPRVEVADTAPPPPAVMTATENVSGGIYQSARYRPMFEDYRARLPGDTLTVQIVEKITATAKSTSSVDKAGSVTAGITALPGISAGSFGRAGAEGSSTNTFAGKGATESSNDFSGTITVVVRGVLPNGHLLIAGEKQIGVNSNVDVLRFSGQVDPRAIQPGNTVQSAQIANVRLEQRGRGQQSEAQSIGWLGRVFLSLAPF
ncbi:MAG: flagellar basal body L-ring protein FlgH [Rubrivivax sp.]|nr:flagellar basal body L-ring protein FlgH [Rubrivivax sp.]